MEALTDIQRGGIPLLTGKVENGSVKKIQIADQRPCLPVPTRQTDLIWKTLIVAEMSFRKLDAPHLVEKVANGTKYENGK